MVGSILPHFFIWNVYSQNRDYKNWTPSRTFVIQRICRSNIANKYQNLSKTILLNCIRGKRKKKIVKVRVNERKKEQKQGQKFSQNNKKRINLKISCKSAKVTMTRKEAAIYLKLRPKITKREYQNQKSSSSMDTTQISSNNSKNLLVNTWHIVRKNLKPSQLTNNPQSATSINLAKDVLTAKFWEECLRASHAELEIQDSIEPMEGTHVQACIGSADYDEYKKCYAWYFNYMIGRGPWIEL